jgi:hypothetical protein
MNIIEKIIDTVAGEFEFDCESTLDLSKRVMILEEEVAALKHRPDQKGFMVITIGTPFLTK